MPAPVTLDRRVDASLQRVADQAAAAGEDISAAIAVARQLGDAPVPGCGRTSYRFELLATLGAADLTAARVVEPHLDAAAILAEAKDAGIETALDAVGASEDSSWGVFAAEGPGTPLTATAGDRITLSGTKPWCSLAGSLSHALITAHTERGRRLFAVALSDPGVHVQPGRWHARGLTAVPSGPVDFDDVPAVPIGDAGWYLSRPGFAWGGIGVAAVWWGGAVGLARALHERCARTPDQPLLAMQLAAVDTALFGAESAVGTAAAQIDGGTAGDAAVLAARVRAVVHDAAESTLQRVGHALGPAPLALDDTHARRVADLTLYLRQHHPERDGASLGTRLAEGTTPPW